MGEVYRAHDAALDRDVAIKFLTPGIVADAAGRARFEREARTLASLHHHNIASIYGFADAGDMRGLVLELVDGETLEARLARGPLPVPEAIHIAAQIAAALAAAHGRGFVHRDLKPANVTLTHDGPVKVLDFGLAKAVGDTAGATALTSPGLTQPGTIVGTPRYMSPEQARGTAVDARTDLWALGCVLYEALTGKPAFAGQSTADVLGAILSSTPDFAALPDAVPADVIELIRCCLDKEPDKRPATAGIAYATLEGAFRRPPIVPKPPRRAAPLVASAILLAVVALGLTIWREEKRPSAPALRPVRSIAVRPLENLARDSTQDYFAEGMTDALTTQLAKAGSLRVISRTSAVRLASRPIDELARVLKVDAVVEGSVLLADERVRVNARLIDASSDSSVWAESYERPLGDVLRLQQDVARAIAQRIQAVAAGPGAELPPVVPAPSVNPDAYRAYLQGRQAWNRRTAESLLQAITHFERAVELQPDYAPAHSGIGEALVLLPAPMVGDRSPSEVLPRARAEALRALQLDPTLASAHAVLARERLQAWDWATADAESKRAVELEPNNADWHFWRGSVLATFGRHDQSIAEARTGVDLDPVSPIVGSGLSWMYHLARRFDDALREARRVLSFEPSFAIAHARVGEAQLALGRRMAAIDAFKRALDASGGSPDMLALMGRAQAIAGERADALSTLKTLQTMRQNRYVSEYDFVLVYAGLADTAQALDWLDRAAEAHAASVSFITVDPAIDILRTQPRFREIVRQIGLTSPGVPR